MRSRRDTPRADSIITMRRVDPTSMPRLVSSSLRSSSAARIWSASSILGNDHAVESWANDGLEVAAKHFGVAVDPYAHDGTTIELTDHPSNEFSGCVFAVIGDGVLQVQDYAVRPGICALRTL